MPRRSYKRRSSGSGGIAASFGRMLAAKYRAARAEAKVTEMRGMLEALGDEAHARVTNYGTTRFANPRGLANVDQLYGRGKYSLGKAWRATVGKQAGRQIRSALLNKGLSLMGAGAYRGRGAYTTNSLMSSKPPQVVSSAADETGAVTVSRLEFLGEIYGPAANTFDIKSYNINPGLETMFPWLSQIAQNYEEYEMIQLVVSFRSTITDIGSSTNGQCGTIIMATNYDPAAAPFTDKAQMMAYDGAMSSKCTESMAHGVECDPSKLSGSAGKYIRAFGLDQTKDLKDYDLGLFQVAVSNVPSGFVAQSIGELWVTYTVKLRKPKFFTGRGLGISRDIFVSNGLEATNNPFGGNILRGLCNNIGCTLVPSGAQAVLTFPPSYAGVVAILFRTESGTAFSAAPVSGTAITVGCQIVEYADMYAAGSGGDSPASFAATGAGLVQFMYEMHVRVSPAQGTVSNSITFNFNTVGTAATQTVLEIKEINSGFSYRYANIGPSDAPILVNAQGNVILP